MEIDVNGLVSMDVYLQETIEFPLETQGVSCTFSRKKNNPLMMSFEAPSQDQKNGTTQPSQSETSIINHWPARYIYIYMYIYIYVY